MAGKIPVVDPDLCAGYGDCVDVCPKVFRMKGDLAEVYNPKGDTEKKIQEAIEACPAHAIKWK